MNGEWCKNVIIFGADNSLSVHSDNRKQDIFLLNEAPTGA